VYALYNIATIVKHSTNIFCIDRTGKMRVTRMIFSTGGRTDSLQDNERIDGDRFNPVRYALGIRHE
jgi:hypothetical protein